jgi:hypothetical protein
MLSGFSNPEDGMNRGKTLFAQVMEFVPRKSFGRSIAKHQGDSGVRTLSCTDLFRVLAFSQLTGRESLRDIEACLAANRPKLFHMGLAQSPARSTLADALNARDWRIYQALALRLIARARTLYAHDCSIPGIDATIYALDARTVDLCLSLFDWAPFCSTRAAIKLHTLLDLRGAIATFVYISDGKLNEVNVLDFLPVEPGSFLCDGSWLSGLQTFLRDASGWGFLRDTSQVCDGCQAGVLQPRGPQQRSDLRSTRLAERPLFKWKIPRTTAPHSLQGPRLGQDSALPHQQHGFACTDHRRTLQKSLADRTVLQLDQTTPANQALSRHYRKRRKDTDMVRHRHLCPDRNHQEGT